MQAEGAVGMWQRFTNVTVSAIIGLFMKSARTLRMRIAL